MKHPPDRMPSATLGGEEPGERARALEAQRRAKLAVLEDVLGVTPYHRRALDPDVALDPGEGPAEADPSPRGSSVQPVRAPAVGAGTADSPDLMAEVWAALGRTPFGAPSPAPAKRSPKTDRRVGAGAPVEGHRGHPLETAFTLPLTQPLGTTGDAALSRT